MQTLKSFLDQSLLIWKDSTAAARFGLVLLLAICVGGIVGVGVWSTQPNYVMLASGLDLAKAGKVIDALESSGIKYQVKGTGSVIFVDSGDFPRARIAAGKFGIEAESMEMEASSVWDPPEKQRIAQRHNLEKQLVHSIQRFPAIESATVVISTPEKQYFIRHSTAPSAAVILEIAPNARFGESQAASIARLVANSVPDLTVDGVAITDTHGTTYSTDESLGRLSKQEEHRVMRDRELAHKAESMLNTFLDFGNAQVQVTSDFTFKNETITSLEYDSKNKATTKEMIKTEIESEPPPAETGSSPSQSGKSIVKSKKEDSTTEFVPSQTKRNETTSTPTMNRLSVAVAINSTATKEVTPELRDKIEATVKSAVGFREDKDQITVEFFEFVVPPEIEAPAFAMPWDQINELIKNLSLGIAAIIAFFVARRAFKKMQPDPSVAPEFANRDSQVNQLSELVKQNPEVFSKIIESWSNLDSEENGESRERKRAA